jgi:hypothetical protein
MLLPMNHDGTAGSRSVSCLYEDFTTETEGG